jgi:hypothetical protein
MRACPLGLMPVNACARPGLGVAVTALRIEFGRGQWPASAAVRVPDRAHASGAVNGEPINSEEGTTKMKIRVIAIGRRPRAARYRRRQCQ